ncbi:MAG TPA: c(7)-type cytochrome triheme domain-containing protein [Candidatus Methanoperedens sp.]|nr:c(7)-type cytochrome triheme domain-containing protein [Candidatus Methanoperedens sp.]
MPHQAGAVSRPAALAALLLLLLPAGASGNYPFPPPPAPEEYGNLLITRAAAAAGVKPVSFSHWLHRQKYTCRVCHFELQFDFEANTTEITEDANRAGMFCGACHNGKELFGHEKPEDCERCHNGDIRRGAEKLAPLWRLPDERYGNRIDWNAALEQGLIAPVNKLTIDPSGEIGFASTILLDAEWPMVPNATFPHGKHTKWLDCNDCHPNLFNIKRKFTAGLRMESIIERQYCGICHGTVAFPLTDCKRCHPDMKKIPAYPEPVSR